MSALGYRAREGLRRAYLDAHLRDAPTPECAEVWPLLAGAIRGGLGPAQQVEVDEHLAGCEHCRAALAELEAVNTRFGAVLAPIVLGAAAPAYLAAVHGGGAAVVTAERWPRVAPPRSAAEAGASATGFKAVLAGLGLTAPPAWRSWPASRRWRWWPSSPSSPRRWPPSPRSPRRWGSPRPPPTLPAGPPRTARRRRTARPAPTRP